MYMRCFIHSYRKHSYDCSCSSDAFIFEVLNDDHSLYNIYTFMNNLTPLYLLILLGYELKTISNSFINVYQINNVRTEDIEFAMDTYKPIIDSKRRMSKIDLLDRDCVRKSFIRFLNQEHSTVVTNAWYPIIQYIIDNTTDDKTKTKLEDLAHRLRLMNGGV